MFALCDEIGGDPRRPSGRGDDDDLGRPGIEVDRAILNKRSQEYFRSAVLNSEQVDAGRLDGFVTLHNGFRQQCID